MIDPLAQHCLAYYTSDNYCLQYINIYYHLIKTLTLFAYQTLLNDSLMLPQQRFSATANRVHKLVPLMTRQQIHHRE